MANPFDQFDANPFDKFDKPSPQGFVANAADFFKSIPRGMVTGLTSLPNPNPALSQDEMMGDLQGRAQAANVVKAPLPAPDGPAGRFGEAVGEGLGNPLTYAGPGGMGLKLGGSLLSSVGGEGGRQAAEGTPFEKPASIAGALAGGLTAAKTLGPKVPKAAIPTGDELKAAGEAGYKAARNTNLQVDPRGASLWAQRVEDELIGPDFGFSKDLAPKTFAKLHDLKAAPERIAKAAADDPSTTGAITASDIDSLRKNLGIIAQETQPANGGQVKPTADAAAATAVLERLAKYSEGMPPGHVLDGSPQDYVRAINDANANWGAGARVRDFDARLTKADNAADRQIAGSLDAQIKSKAGSMLDNPVKMRGLNEAERDQLQLINSGEWKSNTLRQLGRGGAGVIPIMGQLAAAPTVLAAGGPFALAGQAGLAAALYGARKGSEAMTKSRAKELVEMLAKRSPEYERRKAALPDVDTSPNKMALIRALLGAD
jgi:hypothetical protein